MQEYNELMSFIHDLLDEVDEYKQQVEKLHYDNSYREFEFSRGQRNYDKIIRRLQNADLPLPEVLLPKPMDLEEFKQYFVDILRIILGEKYKEDIIIAQSLITPKSYSIKTDVMTVSKNIAGIFTPCEFIVSDDLNPIQLAQVVNSEINVLIKKLYRNFSSTISNIHYKRLPGIIAIYLAIYELSNMLKSKQIVEDYEKYYIHNDSQYANHYGKEVIEALPSYRQKETFDYVEHNTFGFIISDIYTTTLIEKYLEDKISFLKNYRSLIEGGMSIPDFLQHYGITLKDNNVTLKYINKVDQIEGNK